MSADLEPDFLQGRVPKLLDDGSLGPAAWPADPELEWAPPGHGDLYPALAGSGMLARLLDRGYRWAFVSNADNLGATLDPSILAWIAREQIPFLMEVADRTPADRKGGHLARRAGGGGLVLREVAQTPEADLDAFQDISRHRFFNTNTVWLDLERVAADLAGDGVIDLPMIVNRKTVDPADPGSPGVIQLETAMGAAIASFDGAQALRVPRSRFLPVKTTDDLLVLRSDAYVLDDRAHVVSAPGRGGAPPPLVRLDPRWFRLVAEFDARFPHGAPSLVGCDSLDGEWGRAVRAGRGHARDGDRERRRRRAARSGGRHALGGVTVRSLAIAVLAALAVPACSSARPAADRSPRDPVAALTTRQLAGQRIIVGYAGARVPAWLLARVRRGEVGGVIAFSATFARGPRSPRRCGGSSTRHARSPRRCSR